MPPQPLYEPGRVTPAYKLYYAWAGWPHAGTSLPPDWRDVLPNLREPWEADGLRLLECDGLRDEMLLTFSVKPQVAPVFFTGRVKGRLQHALRESGRAARFSRKVGMRSIGENTRADVEVYIEGQVGKERFADPRFEADVRQFTVVDPEVDLSLPSETHSGRYWYNLHLVLVVEGRARTSDTVRLARIRDQSLRIAEKKGYAVSRLAALPDHLHIALRGNVEQSPEDIALAFQNNLAFALGQAPLWQPTYYVGTFSEYDLGAVRGRGE